MKIANASPISTKLPFGSTQLFSYLVPEEMENEIKAGSVVEIPLGTRAVKGVVFDFVVETRLIASLQQNQQLKPIKNIIPNIQLTQHQLDLAMWMHRFYHAPLGIVLKFMVPEIVKKDTRYKIQDTNKNQKSKIKNQKVSQFLDSQNNRFNKYIELIKGYIEINKQVLILVPQIIDVETLYLRSVETRHCLVSTPATRNVGRLHSQLNKTEYFNNWAGFQAGEVDVLIGTRQAVLSPPSNLGLIIIDEPQDEDFKQADQTPRFGAVEVAKKVCEIMEIELVMGSSIPSLDFFDVETQLIASLHQKNISIVDSQNEFYGKNFSPLSNKLQDLLVEAAKNKKWAMLLVNRRGESSFIVCKDCGNVIKCPKCDLPLVLHSDNVETRQCLVSTKREMLFCHHCSYKTEPPAECPKCQSHKIKFSSPGTQGVEKEIIKLLGDKINIVRIDSDSMKTKKGMEEILKKLREKPGAIIGTQVISKIWLPEKIGLIGLLYADSFLNRPDFRSSEKTFQVVRELASHLDEKGKMIIQTLNPENKTIQLAASGNYDQFYKNELSIRKQFNYPPFVRIVKISIYGRDTGKVLREVDKTKKIVASRFNNIEIIGPISAAAKKGLFGKTMMFKIYSWSEEIHLKLIELINGEWTVE